MSNGLNIKDKDTFKELYKEDPGMAVGLAFGEVFRDTQEIKKQYKEFENKFVSKKYFKGAMAVIGSLGGIYAIVRIIEMF